MKISEDDYDEIPFEQRNGIYEIENYGTFHYLNGDFHRLDGPAYENIDGHKEWLYGKYHRLDDPAIEDTGGCEYYIENVQYHSKDEFDKVAYLYLNNLQDYL